MLVASRIAFPKKAPLRFARSWTCRLGHITGLRQEGKKIHFLPSSIGGA